MSRPDAELESSLSGALGQARALVASLGLLEVAHWELEQGVGSVQAVRTHMAGLQQELQAGRANTAMVLVQVGGLVWVGGGGGGGGGAKERIGLG